MQNPPIETLKILLQLLIDSKIDFVLIGGFACIVHGSTQLTQDLDICSSLTWDQIEKFRQALAPFHPKHRMTTKQLSFLEFPEGPQKMNNIYLRTDLGVLDILGTLPEVGNFETLSTRAETFEIEGKKFKVLCLDDLIKAKTIVGRPKDIAAVYELKVIQERLKNKKNKK